MMSWRQLLYTSLIVAAAAFIIELANEPWHTSLTAGASVGLVLWLWERTKGT